MSKYKNLVGNTYNRLTVISFSGMDKKKNAEFLCKCECGNEKIVKAQYLKNGDTKSCGCLNNEKRSERALNFKIINRKFHPSETTARSVYKDKYADGNLTFNEFYILSQNNCYYCNDNLSNKSNVQNNCKKASEYAKQNGDFLYNGLDRINSNLPHDFENCVPCCFKCNAAKHNLTLKEFDDWIIRLYDHLFK